MADDSGPQIHTDFEHLAGVYANYARVGHSPYEFTLDFVRLDFGQPPLQGVVVARVSLSPLLVSQLIEALGDNWSKWVEKSMPPEVSRHDEPRSDEDGEG